MYIRTANQKNVVKMNESAQQQMPIQQSIVPQQVDSPESDVMRIKTKQFTFSSGIIMAKISNESITNKFGLHYHFLNSNGSVDNFVESVRKFIAVGGFDLNDVDENKLRTDYANYLAKC